MAIGGRDFGASDAVTFECADRTTREAAGEETRPGAEAGAALASARCLRALARGSVERRSSPLSARRRMEARASEDRCTGACRRGLVDFLVFLVDLTRDAFAGREWTREIVLTNVFEATTFSLAQSSGA